MDYTQVEEQFKTLKEQFAAGKLDEAAFKARLNELMVQDGQGRWWMIGYETGQWYMHDGSAWVRSEPPGRGSHSPEVAQAEPEPSVQEPAQAEEPPETARVEPAETLPEPVQAQAVLEPAIHEPVQAEGPPAAKTEAQAPVQAVELPPAKAEAKEPGPQAVEKPAGFIPNRAREALLVLVCGAVYGGGVIFESQLVSALTTPIPLLAGIFFGPWVGGLTGALGGLIMGIIYGTRGIDPSGIPGLMLYSLIAGVIPALLVKEPKSWRNVLFATLLVSISLLVRFFVRSVQNFGEDYFWIGIRDNLLYTQVPILLLTSLLARGLIDEVKKRGWYWRDKTEPRKATLTDWKTLFTLSIAWGVLWALIYGTGFNISDQWDLRYIFSVTCGLASGLAAMFILRNAFPALRWGQSLLILAGWWLGFVLATDAFTRVVVYGYVQSDYMIALLILGILGGAGLSAALKLAGVFNRWNQALLSGAVWTGGMVVFAFLATLIGDNNTDRLFISGLLVAAVGVWGIFWQKQQSAHSQGEPPH